MARLRSLRFKRWAGAAALLGAMLNVWVFGVHVTSVALAQLRGGDVILICHSGGFKYVPVSGPDGGKTAPKKGCPICSGLAALHVGVVGESSLDVAPVARATGDVGETGGALVADHRPQKIFNRGPPALV